MPADTVKKTVHVCTFYIGLDIDKTQTRLNINPANEFIDACKAWDQFKPEIMDVCLGTVTG
jgi:poly(A) polymerase Pap1